MCGGRVSDNLEILRPSDEVLFPERWLGECGLAGGAAQIDSSLLEGEAEPRCQVLVRGGPSLHKEL